MAKESLSIILESLTTNILKVISAIPTSTIAIALTYEYGWAIQNLVLIIVAVLQYTIIDIIRRTRKNGNNKPVHRAV